jgi:hypothetical protein
MVIYKVKNKKLYSSNGLVQNVHPKYFLEWHQNSPILVENVNVWGVSKYRYFLLRANKNAPFKKKKKKKKKKKTLGCTHN